MCFLPWTGLSFVPPIISSLHLMATPDLPQGWFMRCLVVFLSWASPLSGGKNWCSHRAFWERWLLFCQRIYTWTPPAKPLWLQASEPWRGLGGINPWIPASFQHPWFGGSSGGVLFNQGRNMLWNENASLSDLPGSPFSSLLSMHEFSPHFETPPQHLLHADGVGAGSLPLPHSGSLQRQIAYICQGFSD